MNALAHAVSPVVPPDGVAKGYTVLPRLFAPEEMGWLAAEARSIGLLHGGQADAILTPEAPPGTIFAPHRYERAFLDLAVHPRLMAALRTMGPFRLHQTRLWPGGRRPVPQGAWSEALAWQRLDGLDLDGAVTAAVFLEDAAADAGLFVWSEDPVLRGGAAREGLRSETPVLLSLPVGSVVLLEPQLFHAPADGSVSAAPTLFFSSLVSSGSVAAGSRRAPFVVELPMTSPRRDECLWPTPYSVAG